MLNQNPAKKQSLSSYKGPASSGKYVVQRNESLWSIANRIAAETKQPVAKVMHDIQTQNRHAFIQGDVNRLRQGIALNLAHSPAAKPQQNKSKTDIAHTAKSTSGTYATPFFQLNPFSETSVAQATVNPFFNA